MSPKTQKEVLTEHGAMLEQLAAAVASLAQSQQQIQELLAHKSVSTANEEEQQREREALANCERVTVFHNFEQPQPFTWNAAYRFVFKPGRNDDVPVIFARMYEQWLANRQHSEEHARRLAERKSYEAQSALLAQTKTPMR